MNVIVGSILAVVSADPHSPDKTNRFVGICIQRAEYCLRANFTLRNVVDGQGMAFNSLHNFCAVLVFLMKKVSVNILT